MTPVIFKKVEGEVIAVFPTIPGTNDPYTMECYVHNGQHGSCSIEWARSVKPANPNEYESLLRELRDIGYDDLVIVHRMREQYTQARQAELDGQKGR